MTVGVPTPHSRTCAGRSKDRPLHKRGSEDPPLQFALCARMRAKGYAMWRLFFAVGVEPVLGVDDFGDLVGGAARETMGLAGEAD